MQLALCYLFPPWWTEVHIILCGERSNNPYLFHPVRPSWMLEVRPLLQRGSRFQKTICPRRPNITHRAPSPSSKVEVGTWIGHAYHRHVQRNG